MFLLEKARPAKQIKILISDRMLHISVEKLGNLTKHAFFFFIKLLPMNGYSRPTNLWKVIINITVKIRQFYYDTRVESWQEPRYIGPGYIQFCLSLSIPEFLPSEN